MFVTLQTQVTIPSPKGWELELSVGPPVLFSFGRCSGPRNLHQCYYLTCASPPYYFTSVAIWVRRALLCCPPYIFFEVTRQKLGPLIKIKFSPHLLFNKGGKSSILAGT